MAQLGCQLLLLLHPETSPVLIITNYGAEGVPVMFQVMTLIHTSLTPCTRVTSQKRIFPQLVAIPNILKNPEIFTLFTATHQLYLSSETFN
jgi:hypothetical protein